MPDLIEGEDFYYEGQYIVFTAKYLLKRGYCCESGCRHCPYGFKKDQRSDVPVSGGGGDDDDDDDDDKSAD